jgi:prepilin-type N-terminal cleavage/methylation domain-containing protein/prepilin-type processing-associated H-X9-DG protein
MDLKKKIMMSKETNKDICKGFTLVELLVVISIIALLLAVLMPSLNKARESAKKVVCGSQMRQFATAVYAFALDSGQIPWFQDAEGKSWTTAVNKYLNLADNVKNLRCPAKACIGVNYYLMNTDGPGEPLAPFCNEKYNNFVSVPVKLDRVKHPSDWLLLMDSSGAYVYNPRYATWAFKIDVDGDGFYDSGDVYPPFTSNKVRLTANLPLAYNFAMPKVHSKGSNVALSDGHVEWVSYKDLWKVGADKKTVTHHFWYGTK